MSGSKDKVLLAMSGGVDSAVAGWLLQSQGYDVTGVFMCLGSADNESRGCCSPADAADARRIADQLGIDLFVMNLAEDFAPIVENFLDEYARGRTPNPCIHCNARIKFGRLVQRADQLGIDYIATGHHARIASRPAGVLRGLSAGKDQSYALFAVDPGVLARVLLPVGEMADKGRVREIAAELGLHVHDKPDSQEVCFVPDDDYVALLRLRRGEAMAAGEIVNAAGDVLGHHDGYGQYTIGQRRGVGVAAGVPMYVTHIDPGAARVTIGPRAEVMGTRLTAEGANWHADVPIGEPFDAVAQIRYNHAGCPARVTRTDADRFTVELAQPVHAITPGQAAVIYEGDRLLGGGWIDDTRQEV